MATKYVNEEFGIIDGNEKEILEACKEKADTEGVYYLHEHELIVLAALRYQQKRYEQKIKILYWSAFISILLIIFIFAYHNKG
jgi:hypothetical protein